MSSHFQTLLDESRDELEAVAFFVNNGIPIRTEFDRVTVGDEVRDIQSLLSNDLADVGLVVVLLWDQMSIPGAREGESGPIFHDSAFTVRVLENAETNQTGANRLEAIEEAVKALHMFKPQSANSELCVAAPGIVRWIDDSGLFVGYDATMITTESLTQSIEQAETPVIVYEDLGDPFTVEMTSATVGAAIFYTTNGKKPNPRNGTLYTGHFVLANPTTLKARAWLSGYLASEVGTATAGTVTPPDMVTFEQIRQAFIDQGGKTQFSADGQLLGRDEVTGDYSRIMVSTAEGVPSVIAADGEAEQP